MWTFTTKVLFSVALIASSASATWRPIVGPSSSSFNTKIPFGESHTYYGNEFLSEYAGLGNDHLLVQQPAISVPASTGALSSYGSDVKKLTVHESSQSGSNERISLLLLFLQITNRRTSAVPKSTHWSTRALYSLINLCPVWISSPYATGCGSRTTRVITPFSRILVSVNDHISISNSNRNWSAEIKKVARSAPFTTLAMVLFGLTLVSLSLSRSLPPFVC